MQRHLERVQALERNLQRLEHLRPRLDHNPALTEQLERSITTMRTLLANARRHVPTDPPTIPS